MAVAVGDLVHYHGSKATAHGVYQVVLVPLDPDARGYALENDRIGVVRDVHPTSFTKLTGKEEGGSAMKPTKKDAGVQMNNIDSYDIPTDDEVEDQEFDPSGWTDTIPLLIWAVRKGLLDPHLRVIGEEMRDRYRLLFPDLKPPARSEPVSFPGGSNDLLPVDEVEKLSLLGRDEQLKSTTRTGVGVVEYGGARFLKRDMVGKHFRLPEGVLGDKGVAKHVGGKVVQIISVGRTRLRIRLAEELPWATRPDFVQRVKTGQWDVDFTEVDFIFGV